MTQLLGLFVLSKAFKLDLLNLNLHLEAESSRWQSV